MAKLVFGMVQALDGYVDGVTGELLELPPPGPVLFGHLLAWVRDLAGGVYGRRTYEVMRYWSLLRRPGSCACGGGRVPLQERLRDGFGGEGRRRHVGVHTAP